MLIASASAPTMVRTVRDDAVHAKTHTAAGLPRVIERRELGGQVSYLWIECAEPYRKTQVTEGSAQWSVRGRGVWPKDTGVAVGVRWLACLLVLFPMAELQQE